MTAALITSITEMIACFANDQVLKSLHRHILINPAKARAHIDGLNLALGSLARESPCIDLVSRYDLVLELFGHDVDLFNACHLQFHRSVRGSDTVVEKLLIEAARRFAITPSQELITFADSCLAQVVVHTRISKVYELLETYAGFAGTSTIQTLLNTPVIIRWDIPVMNRIYKPLLRQNSLNNLTEFTSRVIRSFIGILPFKNLIDLLELDIPGISLSPTRLTLGSHTYVRSNRQIADPVLWREIPARQVICHLCPRAVISIYIRPEGSHGIFYCENCAGDRANKAVCAICFSDDTEAPQLKIAACNHVFCSECCEKISRCPMCRAEMSSGLKVSIPEAIEVFVAESSA